MKVFMKKNIALHICMLTALSVFGMEEDRICENSVFHNDLSKKEMYNQIRTQWLKEDKQKKLSLKKNIEYFKQWNALTKKELIGKKDHERDTVAQHHVGKRKESIGNLIKPMIEQLEIKSNQLNIFFYNDIALAGYLKQTEGSKLSTQEKKLLKINVNNKKIAADNILAAEKILTNLIGCPILQEKINVIRNKNTDYQEKSEISSKIIKISINDENRRIETVEIYGNQFDILKNFPFPRENIEKEIKLLIHKELNN